MNRHDLAAVVVITWDFAQRFERASEALRSSGECSEHEVAVLDGSRCSMADRAAPDYPCLHRGPAVRAG